MERWRRWGLTREEWDECVEASAELAALPDAPWMSPEEIAAQLAVAKAAEEPLARLDVSRRIWIDQL